MKPMPAANTDLHLLLCTRAPRRRRAPGGSQARRQRQNPPPEEPRKRRQRAPSWATAPLANSLGTRSVRSSRRSRALSDHSWLLAERERQRGPFTHLARCAELGRSPGEHFLCRGGDGNHPELQSSSPWALCELRVLEQLLEQFLEQFLPRLLTHTKTPLKTKTLKTRMKSEVLTNNELCGGEQRFGGSAQPQLSSSVVDVHQNLAKIGILGHLIQHRGGWNWNFLQK